MKKQGMGGWISILLFVFGAVLFALPCYYTGRFPPLSAIAAIMIVVSIVVGIYTQRCPFCRKYLSLVFFDGKKQYCPYCGTDFDKDSE